MIFHLNDKTLIRLSEGSLSDRRASKVRGHLEVCPTCAKRFALLNDISTVNKPARTLAPDFADRIAESLPAVRPLQDR